MGQGNKSILKEFDEVVEDFPDRLAVKFEEEESLTYAQLDKLVNKIAFLLEQKLNNYEHQNINNINPQGIIIPIYIPKSVYSLGSIYAILKLGHSYVFIDKNTPEKRVEYLLKQVNASVIIDEEFICELKNLDCVVEPVVKERYIKNDNLACVCFTSGSTGEPKGVMINYKQISYEVANTTLTLLDVYDVEKFLIISSFSFIASVSCSLAILYHGRCLFIVSDDNVQNINYLVKYSIQNSIDACFFPPQFAKIFLQYGDGVLKTIIVAVDKVSNIYSNKTMLLNLYGITETICFITSFRIDRAYMDTPIGKPLDDVDVYLLDDNLNKVSEGEVGEICVARKLAIGYLNDEELTYEKFILNPYSASDEDKVLFRTGDLAYRNEEDDLVYLQRKDFMFNVHGYRVEPSEVENALNSIEGVNGSVVAGFDISRITGIENDISIYAGVVTDAEIIDIEKIKEELTGMVPYYMVPSVIERIDSVPVNSRGKLDRKNALPKDIIDIYLSNTDALNMDDVEGVTELERSIIDLVRDIIPGHDFSVDTNLMSVGLHSILLMQFSNEIYKKYRVDILRKNRLKSEDFNVSNISKVIKKNIDRDININNGINFNKSIKITQKEALFIDLLNSYDSDPNKEMLITFMLRTNNINIDVLQSVLEMIVDWHEILKTHLVRKDDGSYLREYLDKPQKIVIHKINGINLSEEELWVKSRQFNEDIDIFKGKPFTSVYLKTGFEEGRLYFALHHLYFDYYSKEIFIRNIHDLYMKIINHDDTNNVFGIKGTSYQQWVEEFLKYGEKVKPNEQAFWDDILLKASKINNNLKKFLTNEKRVNVFSIDKKTSFQLIKNVNQSKNYQLVDFIIGALTYSLYHLTKMEENGLLIQSHGRQHIADSINITNTIGYFASNYPTIVKSFNGNLKKIIQFIKNMRIETPNGGIGFEAIFANNTNLTVPVIYFNFLGNINIKRENDKEHINLNNLYDPNPQHQIMDNIAPFQEKDIIRFYSLIVDNQIVIKIFSRLKREETKKLLDNFEIALKEINKMDIFR